ncbi:NUDIX domain-containing protein [Candidatus Gracilibacteria bacterium]|nr:NUDIX domain-containing protein [Candidatus Gracilibacteria bacterium]
MTADKYMVTLKVFLTNRDGETLILENSDMYHSRGFYDVPGGRIDEDELYVDYQDILGRELLEELGEDLKAEISLKPVSMGRFEYRQDRIFLLMFEADYISGNITISEEHKSYKWVKLNEIDLEKYFTLGMLEAVKRYLEFK